MKRNTGNFSKVISNNSPYSSQNSLKFEDMHLFILFKKRKRKKSIDKNIFQIVLYSIKGKHVLPCTP